MKKIILLMCMALAILPINAQVRNGQQVNRSQQPARTQQRVTRNQQASKPAPSSQSSMNDLGIYIIPQFGFNLSNASGIKIVDTKMRPGINAGINAEFAITPQFSIQPGLFYSMQGTKLSGSVESVSVSTTAQVDYLNIPIYAKAYIGGASMQPNTGFYFFAGPQFGFNTRAKLSGIKAFGIKLDTELADLKDYVKTFDFSIGIGAGYQDKSGLMFSVNYNFGLTNMIDDSSTGGSIASYVASPKNGVLQINLGYRF